MGVNIVVRGNSIKIMGEEEKVEESGNIINKLLDISTGDKNLGKQEVKYLVELLKRTLSSICMISMMKCCR